jgi:glutamine synthetase
MENLRNSAINRAFSHQPIFSTSDFVKASDIFGTNVFGKETMREYLSPDTFNAINDVIEEGAVIDISTAGEIASAMKAWAIKKGATHYTHLFQPLHGSTAEKHDAFITPFDFLRSIERFEGSQLIQQEPDASSFPSGGIRNTFEARGYTAWDIASPAFILGSTLCIPTIFISYTGEALDYKTPLLKALSLLDKASVGICQYFDRNVNRVIATLGWEQEYFLIDEAIYNARPDLIMTGKTMLGHASAKNQQLEDHYFGTIADRVLSFMRDFEIEAWKLGIPVKTRHNEVAPNQFEIAPLFEEANLANDHNQLIMVIMEKVARKHFFRVSFHEKPFSGINGSGKHNNWSLMTNTGKNLLSPGKTPKNNLQFLTFFINIIKSVHDYADLLRASIASSGNEHRLGANEAPPAIISVFIGSQLTNVLKEIETKVKSGKMTADDKTTLKLEIGKIPEIILDNSDRNRTSPFAFTGNKFEFRAVGASANCANPMIVLNTALANQLIEFKIEVDKLIDTGVDKEEAILKILREYIISSKKILFEGNNYSEEWLKEAEKRGLPNIKNAPHALKALISEKNVKLFERHNIFSEKEVHARFHIELENYFKKIQIESRILGELVLNNIIPAAIEYQNKLIENVKGIKEIYDEIDSGKLNKAQMELISEISERVSLLKNKVMEMTTERKKANQLEDHYEHAKQYCEKVKPFFEEIRYNVDKLELIVDDKLWPLPKYREILFVK